MTTWFTASSISAAVVAAPNEKLFENGTEVFLILGDQDLDTRSGRGRGHSEASSAGNKILKVLPDPGVLSTSMRPPWSAMMP